MATSSTCVMGSAPGGRAHVAQHAAIEARIESLPKKRSDSSSSTGSAAIRGGSLASAPRRPVTARAAFWV